jgi:serine/threonine protein kinase
MVLLLVLLLLLLQGTMSHMAPEVMLQGRISKAADVYSFGITLWDLFTGEVTVNTIVTQL